MRALPLFLFALVSSASACLWDRDTLAAEANGRMEMVDVIVGRFERNPDLYFSMRVERATKDVAKNPRDWEAYEDLAVAYDRLGKSTRALETAQRQLKEMTAARLAKESEHWYRLDANLGTFWAHRYFREGRKDGAMLDAAIGRIRSAIRRNPDAHFGREYAQLGFLEWAKGGFNDDLYKVIEAEAPRKGSGSQKEYVAAAVALAGLIRLGNAWESADVFFALESCLKLSGQGAIGHLALLRRREILADDNAPFFHGKRTMDPGPGPDVENAEYQIGDNYPKLRQQAEDWQKRRLDFMMPRLQAGRHPDTDPTFWDGWDPGLPLRIEAPSLPARIQWEATTPSGLLAIAGLCMVGAVTLYVKRRSRRKAR